MLRTEATERQHMPHSRPNQYLRLSSALEPETTLFGEASLDDAETDHEPNGLFGNGHWTEPFVLAPGDENDENSVAETFGFPTLVENERPIQEVLSSVDLSKKL